jgi:arylsulfatase A-like enzyme
MKRMLLACLLASLSSPFPGAAKPNFVFFLVDDLGWGDLGCYGSRFHETPNLDRLAREGVRFTQAYSACTVCSPSRAAILTGRYPGRLHLTDWIKGHGRRNAKLLIPKWNMRMDPELTTMPEALKQAGYRTQFIGKWHLMPIGAPDFEDHYPDSHGFDHNVAGREWGQPKGPGKYFSPFGMPNLDDGKKGDFLTDRLTDAAVDFIERAKQDPFLLYFSYYTVHGPIMTKPALLEKYKAKAKGFDNSRNENLNPAYAGMIESLDDSVGRVLDKLKAAGLDRNTVVIFTADNGGVSTQSSGGLRGAKALSYEGGTREPALVKWPGKARAGSTCEVPVIGTDFYPTMLDMAGLALRPKAHLDGLSLVPLLNGTSKTLGREDLFWHYPHYHRTPPYGAIRRGDYKLIEFFEEGKVELYDLAADPAESRNLAASQPEKAEQLLTAMRAWRSEVDAQMPTPNPNFDPSNSAPKRNKRTGKASKPVSTPLGLVSASSYQVGNPPESGLDRVPGSRWAAASDAVPQWWMLEFPEPRQLTGVNIRWKNPTWYSHRIEVSGDGKQWKTVSDATGSGTLPATSTHAFTTQARFLRVTVDGLGSGWVTFSELEPVFAR